MGPKYLLPVWPARAHGELYFGIIPTFPVTKSYSMVPPSWRWEGVGTEGGCSFSFEIYGEADSNGCYFLEENFFWGRELKRITCQEPVPSFTMEENLFREDYFMGKKMTLEHLKYLDLWCNVLQGDWASNSSLAMKSPITLLSVQVSNSSRLIDCNE